MMELLTPKRSKKDISFKINITGRSLTSKSHQKSDATIASALDTAQNCATKRELVPDVGVKVTLVISVKNLTRSNAEIVTKGMPATALPAQSIVPRL